jgi:hypothetical protein
MPRTLAASSGKSRHVRRNLERRVLRPAYEPKRKAQKPTPACLPLRMHATIRLGARETFHQAFLRGADRLLSPLPVLRSRLNFLPRHLPLRGAR